MLRLPLEIENTTTLVENADRSRLRRSDHSEATTYVQEVMLPGGRRVLVPGEKKISRVVMDLVNNTVSSQTPHEESIALETSPKSRSSMWATVGKFLTNFACCRLGSGQQNDKDSKDLPNIFAEGEENPFFPVFDGRSGDHFSNKVTAELVHQKTSNKTEDVEMSNSPSMIVSDSSQVSRLDRRREKILANVI